MDRIFNIDKLSIEDFKSLEVPYKYIKLSKLGGADNTSLIMYISMDSQESWINRIYHNSRYYTLSLSINGVLEVYSRGHSTNIIRKKRVKSILEAVLYINSKIK
jgi:hypothetical protein